MSDPLNQEVPRHQTVRAVVKAMQLLLRIADAPDGLAAAQAARDVGIPLATAYHLVNTMLSEGFLARDSSRRYHLGPKIATLAVAYSRNGPSEELLAEVRNLAHETGETAYLSAWRDNRVVALATIEGSNPVRVGGIHTELRGMEHARASGKLMLAHLADDELDRFLSDHTLASATRSTITSETDLRRELTSIRENGYATEVEEFSEGVGCVSAPIFHGPACAGCLTISAPLQRFEQNAPALVEAALKAAARQSTT